MELSCQSGEELPELLFGWQGQEQEQEQEQGPGRCAQCKTVSQKGRFMSCMLHDDDIGARVK